MKIKLGDLPAELRGHRTQATRSPDGSRNPLVDELYARVTGGGECFWSTVYPLYMQRDITRTDVRDLVRKGPRGGSGQLQDRGSPLQHGSSDYKKFLNFLRKHECQLPFQTYRQFDRESFLASSARERPDVMAGAPMGHA